MRNPHISLQEYNLIDQIGQEFWHTVIKVDGVALSGGHGVDKNHSRSVAVAEYLERSEFFKISKADTTIKKNWGLNIIPTGCGFAAGFNQRNTIIRSISEALERWALSMWVDEGYILPEYDANSIFDENKKPALWYKSQFDSVRFFGKEFVVEVSGNFLKINIVVSVCFKDSGVFMGSAAGINKDLLWTHALIESYRHFRIANTHTAEEAPFPFNRILFFSQNADLVKNYLKSFNKSDWKKPNLIFNHCAEFENGSYFLARSIFDGWKSWNLGGQERFLY